MLDTFRLTGTQTTTVQLSNQAVIKFSFFFFSQFKSVTVEFLESSVKRTKNVFFKFLLLVLLQCASSREGALGALAPKTLTLVNTLYIHSAVVKKFTHTAFYHFVSQSKTT